MSIKPRIAIRKHEGLWWICAVCLDWHRMAAFDTWRGAIQFGLGWLEELAR